MKVIKIIITGIIMSSAIAGSLCPKNKNIKAVAKDLAFIEMSGIRLLAGAKEDCLKNEYNEYHFNHDPDYDSPKSLQYLLNSKEDISIEEVKLVDEEVYIYEVSFSAQVEDVSGKNVTVKDKIRFALNTTEKSQRAGGCAMLLESPEKQILLKSCQK